MDKLAYLKFINFMNISKLYFFSLKKECKYQKQYDTNDFVKPNFEYVHVIHPEENRKHLHRKIILFLFYYKNKLCHSMMIGVYLFHMIKEAGDLCLKVLSDHDLDAKVLFKQSCFKFGKTF